MIIRKISYLLLAGILLAIVSACGSYARYYDEPVDIPARRHVSEQVSHRSNRGATRRGPVTRTIVPKNPHRPPGSWHTPSAPGRVVPHSAAHPQGPVIQAPDYHAGYYEHVAEPGPQAIQAVPPEPGPALQAGHPPLTSPAPAVNPASENTTIIPSNTNQRELASHKTEFDTKAEGRANNITRASGSINGKVVKPGETFSYNETVGPTIESRGYEEGVIFVEGEKKKGFGGGVCQVSTTLSIAADNAGLTIIERHDHSLPVSYAKEGEEAATSYGGIDFKFKNELGFSVVINSSVEGGNITVSICEA